MKIAIIGSGISGLSAAWLLNDLHDITVFEKASRLGGHSNTVDVDYDGTRVPVDTGFIVYNELNYPNLTALFRHLNVATEDSNMSFSFSSPVTASEWCGDTLDTVFTYRRNIIRPQFLGMLGSILRFNKVSKQDLDSNSLGDISLGAYLESRGFGGSFCDRYLLPMGAAIWSTSLRDMLEFPAASFIRFFANHRLINPDRERPQWRTVSGGSREYVKRLAQPFQDRVRLDAHITDVSRTPDGVRLAFQDGDVELYDEVVFACHSDEALALLSDPGDREQELLGAIRYSSNKAILHRDTTFMPRRRKAWGSWNYMREADPQADQQPASVTYWMNRLQNISHETPLFVSLNPSKEPDPAQTFATFDYMHPLYDRLALKAQSQLHTIQGVKNTWFCGAYFGYGFHEDGLVSGINVAEQLGAKRPWAIGEIAPEDTPALQAAE